MIFRIDTRHKAKHEKKKGGKGLIGKISGEELAFVG